MLREVERRQGAEEGFACASKAREARRPLNFKAVTVAIPLTVFKVPEDLKYDVDTYFLPVRKNYSVCGHGEEDEEVEEFGAKESSTNRSC